MLRELFNRISSVLKDESGLTSTEYSTMGGAMAGGVFTMSDALTQGMGTAMDNVTGAVSGDVAAE
jgi:Flp pilus assembly pilin Flp